MSGEIVRSPTGRIKMAIYSLPRLNIASGSELMPLIPSLLLFLGQL
jgi:hypothetical protein